MPNGFVYILECSDGSFYTGSTINIEQRLNEHNNGQGANHTKKRLPVKLVFLEEFDRIDDAFNREKQIQGWSRNKKIALINRDFEKLPELAECKNESHFKKWLRLRSATNQHSLIIDKEKNMQTYYSHGKLLLTAEYVVLDGAKALAIPTVFGQSLHVEKEATNKLTWNSLDHNENIWFNAVFSFQNETVSIENTTNSEISNRLLQIITAVKQLNPKFLKDEGFKISTVLEFPKNWGLGTSSTLINNIANWAKVDAYKLLELTFGGSGYDIACAQEDSTLTYQLNDKKRVIEYVNFNPNFKNNLYFVHLNKKQNSRDGIAHYKANRNNLEVTIATINAITEQMIICETLDKFQSLINEHEQTIASVTNQIPVKQLLFDDFNGSIKSLGAWGGDFILVASKNNPTEYFKNKGFDTILSYTDMVL